MNQSASRSRGFTLIELLVVIAIIGLLSAIVLASLNVARVKGYDATRKSSLTQVQEALELYYNDNGLYPKANNSYNTGGAGYGYASQCQVGGNVANANNIITGLVSGGYIAQIPTDTQTSTSGNNCCYEYFVSSTGSDYKFTFFKGTSPAGNCALSAAGTGGGLIDPVRSGAWAVYSNNGASF